MKNICEILSKTSLFRDIDEKNIEAMLPCINASIRKFSKDSVIYNVGDIVRGLSIVAEGAVHIVREDYWGNRSILAEAEEGELFGESYACLGKVPVQVGVIAVMDSVIVELDCNKILSVCSNSCIFHSRLIKNLLFVLAGKNILLSNKADALSQRSIRGKIITYLSQQSAKIKSSSFDIPFNRQQLADYLAADRSAVSKELCKMRDEGILLFNKNHFELK